MKLELSLHAHNLKNVAGAFKGTSDPFAVVTRIATTKGAQPIVLGKTEVMKNSLSPRWVKILPVDYELGEPYKVVISIFDEVRKGDNKPMGSAVFEIGELLGARGNTKAKKLKNGGTLFAMVRKAQGSGTLRLKMKGEKLKNVEGMFSKSDPFFELSRKVDVAGGLTWDNVFRSNPIKNNLDPDWEAAVLDVATLCGGDLDSPVQIAVFDHEKSGNHVSMGLVEISVNGMIKAAESNEKISLTHKGKSVGTITIQRAELYGMENVTESMATMRPIAEAAAAFVPSPSPSAPPQSSSSSSSSKNSGGRADFADYISGGCELNVVVAIDFTGSNGDPRKPGTLHFLHPQGSGMMNDYEKAMKSILHILSSYDSDQKFPVYGFGAKYSGVVRHCFQCGPNPEAHGVKGVLDAYRSVFSSGLIMSSPTQITDVIETAASRAQRNLDEAQKRGAQAYTILLILTDGAVSDVQATADCLARHSDAPISLVIVGVGNADFSAMHFLDDCATSCRRDIAQFVPFNQYSQNSVELTSVTLHEIPDQLVGYFQSKGIQPLPFKPRSDGDISVRGGGGYGEEEEEEEIDLSLDIQEEEIVVSGGGYQPMDDFSSGFRR